MGCAVSTRQPLTRDTRLQEGLVAEKPLALTFLCQSLLKNSSDYIEGAAIDGQPRLESHLHGAFTPTWILRFLL